MATHIGLRNAVKLLAAIERKIAEVGDDPNLETARNEAETMLNDAGEITPRQRTLLKDFIKGVLATENTLTPTRSRTLPDD
jgi:hypothetical protein